MAMLASSIAVNGSDDERGPEGSESSPLQHGKIVM